MVATFSDLEKAQKVRNRLAQVGIPTEVGDESKLQKYWFLSRPLAADKVIVDEKDFDRASARSYRLLMHRITYYWENFVVRNAGSANIEYPQFTRKFITTTLVEVFCFLHIVDKMFYCKQCQYTGSASIALRHKTDVSELAR